MPSSNHIVHTHTLSGHTARVKLIDGTLPIHHDASTSFSFDQMKMTVYATMEMEMHVSDVHACTGTALHMTVDG